jgi:N-acetylated-alpha-linked acidic dipeptidase
MVKSDWSLKPLYDVIAKIPGTSEADEWVIRGNHHDAWVNGAEDPISGLVAELEEARALGQIYKEGWRPKRTIIYAAWDGEEPGLLGSTEWSEAHADELTAHAVAYLNSDTNGRGYLGMEGSHTLERLINEVAKDTPDPETNSTAWRRLQASNVIEGRTEARDARDLPIGALGSGSDFTPFLQHLGVASLNLGFGGEDDGGIYHSIYDDFYWYTHFSDTSFVYGRALAQVAGTAVMRLASADLLPFVFENLANTTKRYETELQSLRDRRATSIAEEAKRIDAGDYGLVRDPRDPKAAPAKLTPPPHFDFSPLANAQDSLSAAAKAFEDAYSRWLKVDSPGSAAQLKAVNELLLKSEREFLATDGLSHRPWFKHLLYAPGLYTGYDVKTMPGIREAIEQGQWSDVDPEIRRVAAALLREAHLIDSAVLLLNGKPKIT